MTNKTKWIIGIVVAVLILSNVSGYIIGIQKQKAKQAEITRLADENQTFTRIITKNRDVITQQEQRVTTLEMAKAALLINVEELKALGVKNASTVIHLQTEIERLKLEAQFNNKPVIIHDTVNGIPNDYLRVPMGWNFSDKWINIIGTVKVGGVTIDTLTSYSEPSIILGYSRGFLKKSKPIIIYKDANPYNYVRDMSNTVIVTPKPFYQKAWFHMLEGAAIFYGGQYAIKQLK